MKTIREWFMEFPEEIRERALSNIGYSKASKLGLLYTTDNAATADTALHGAFAWEFSPEGHDFWDAWATWLSDPAKPKPTILPADHEPELIPDAWERRKELRLQIALAALPGVAAKDLHSSSVAIRAFEIADEMIKLHERGY
jgi:hypothetical protein